MSGYTFEKHTHYTTIRFTSELSEMKWEDVDKSTSKVTELVLESGMHSVLVDLSRSADTSQWRGRIARQNLEGNE